MKLRDLMFEGSEKPWSKEEYGNSMKFYDEAGAATGKPLPPVIRKKIDDEFRSQQYRNQDHDAPVRIRSWEDGGRNHLATTALKARFPDGWTKQKGAAHRAANPNFKTPPKVSGINYENIPPNAKEKNAFAKRVIDDYIKDPHGENPDYGPKK